MLLKTTFKWYEILFLDLFAKDDELSLFLFGQSSQDLGDLQGSETFVVFPTDFHVNATVSSHGKGSTDGFLINMELQLSFIIDF